MLNVEFKDQVRIANMIKRSKGDHEKLLSLAMNMANAIQDPAKAQRRADAAKMFGLPEVVGIFKYRVKQLNW